MFTLLTVVVFLCSILTYVIKSGDYQRETKQIGTLTRTVVIPGTYMEVPKHYSLKGVIIGEKV